MATNLDLCNMVVRESGLGLEDLTAGTFPNASFVDPMYTKVKQWVNQAWKTTQLEREDQKWRVNTAIVVVNPRLRFYDAVDMGGGTFTGNAVTSETEVEFALAPPIWTDVGETEGYAEIVGYPTTADTLGDDNTFNSALRYGESILFPDSIAPSSTYKFFGWGEYNLTDQNEPLDSPITDIQDIHLTTMRVLSDNSSDTDGQPLNYIPWSDWSLGISENNNVIGTPRYYTMNLQGKLLFRPALDKPYRLKFTYTKQIQNLVLHNDVPQGLRSDFHEMIGWLALAQYGQYDCQPNVVSYARENYMRYKRRIERLEMPTVYFNPATRW